MRCAENTLHSPICLVIKQLSMQSNYRVINQRESGKLRNEEITNFLVFAFLAASRRPTVSPSPLHLFDESPDTQENLVCEMHKLS